MPVDRKKEKEKKSAKKKKKRIALDLKCVVPGPNRFLKQLARYMLLTEGNNTNVNYSSSAMLNTFTSCWLQDVCYTVKKRVFTL